MVVTIQWSTHYRVADLAYKKHAITTTRYKIFQELATKCNAAQHYSFSFNETDIPDRSNDGYNIYTITLELR